MKEHFAFIALALAVGSFAAPVAADTTDDAFTRASEALAKNDTKKALLELEALADRGVVNPDISFNRGLAYAARARTSAAQPGDLGRAAAGFEEAARLAPTDVDAPNALGLVRAEVARKRSRQDKADTIVRPTLDRVVMEQFSPTTWGLAAIGASLLMSIGLLLRFRPPGWLQVAGSVLAPISFVALLALGPFAYFARVVDAETRPGVIVVTEAALQDEGGKNTDAPVIPEATLVELSERRGENVFVRWGTYEGWLPHTTVRPLALE